MCFGQVQDKRVNFIFVNCQFLQISAQYIALAWFIIMLLLFNGLSHVIDNVKTTRVLSLSVGISNVRTTSMITMPFSLK